MTSDAKPVDQFTLWIAWAWIEIEAGDKAKASLYLCAATNPSLGDTADVATVTPHQLLSARQTLSGDLGCFISTSQFDSAVLAAESLAMLEYLTSPGGSESTSVAQGNITAAMDRIWMVSEALCKRDGSETEAHERILQTGARLLYLHASRGYVLRLEAVGYPVPPDCLLTHRSLLQAFPKRLSARTPSEMHRFLPSQHHLSHAFHLGIPEFRNRRSGEKHVA